MNKATMLDIYKDYGSNELVRSSEAYSDVVDELIVKCYKVMFERDKEPPDLRELVILIAYEFETKAYDLVYGLPPETISTHWIGTYLCLNRYVFVYGDETYGNAQSVMFKEIYDESDYSYYDDSLDYYKESEFIGQPKVRNNRNKLQRD